MFTIIAQVASEGEDTLNMIIGGGCILLVVIIAFYLAYGKH